MRNFRFGRLDWPSPCNYQDDQWQVPLVFVGPSDGHSVVERDREDRMKPYRKINGLLALGLFAAMSVTSTLSAQEIAIQPLFSDAPGDLSGKQMTVVEVTVPPGASMPGHRHPGSVFGYVLEGSMQHQLAAESEPTIYQAGQTWFEPPDAHHIVFKNPSDSETARVLAVLFGDKDAELVIPDAQ